MLIKMDQTIQNQEDKIITELNYPRREKRLKDEFEELKELKCLQKVLKLIKRIKISYTVKQEFRKCSKKILGTKKSASAAI